jgi:hypothetical protein
VKRLLGALAGGVAVFGLIFAMAASLNFTSDSLGAGTAVVASCQAGVMNAQYASTYTPASSGYTTGIVTVTGLTAPCYSLPFRVSLTGAAGASLGEVTGTTPAVGTSFTATFTTVSESSILGIAAVISNH